MKRYHSWISMLFYGLLVYFIDLQKNIYIYNYIEIFILFYQCIFMLIYCWKFGNFRQLYKYAILKFTILSFLWNFWLLDSHSKNKKIKTKITLKILWIKYNLRCMHAMDTFNIWSLYILFILWTFLLLFWAGIFLFGGADATGLSNNNNN